MTLRQLIEHLERIADENDALDAHVENGSGTVFDSEDVKFDATTQTVEFDV